MPASATVIIPTFGNASFACWPIKSVQNQTVKNIEICIICDGSPETMVSFFKSMEKEDQRIKVCVFPKSPRTGEPYRDIVIKETTGRNIFYCSHDDLWLPHHIQELEHTLEKSSFTHSLHPFVNVPENVKDENTIFGGIHCVDLKKQRNIDKLLVEENLFGLTFGAHTRESYDRLAEGWVTTPFKNIATDLYMWRKFLSAYPKQCRTTMSVTALNFPFPARKDWTEKARYDELEHYYNKIQKPEFLQTIEQLSPRLCPPPYPIKMKRGLHKLEGIGICFLQAWEVFSQEGVAVLLKKIKKVGKM